MDNNNIHGDMINTDTDVNMGNSTPLTFDHPEKLAEGITLDEGDIYAKSFISESNGDVKFNIIVRTKSTGKEISRDVVIGTIEDEE